MLSASHGRASRAEPKRTQSLKETWRKPIKTGADTTASLLLSTICLKLNLRIHSGSQRTQAEPMNHWEVTAPPSHLPAPCVARGQQRLGKPQAGEHRARALPGQPGASGQAEVSFLPTKELDKAGISKSRDNVSIERAGLVSPLSLRSQRSGSFCYACNFSNYCNAFPGQCHSGAEIHYLLFYTYSRRTQIKRSPSVIFLSCLGS